MFVIYVCDRYTCGEGIITFGIGGMSATIRWVEPNPDLCASPSESAWMVPTWENFMGVCDETV